MRYFAFAALIAVATVTLIASPLDALAHGVHGPVSPSVGGAYTPPPDATWWEAIYGNITHNMGVLLKSAGDGTELGAYVSLLVLAFGYGVLHAVGPGHGKLLLASYVAATRAPVALGIVMALGAAALQASIAIGVVLVVALGVQGVTTAVPALQGAVNVLSLALLAALGVVIVLRQLTALDLLPKPVARAVPASSCACCGGDHHGHHGHHDHHASHGGGHHHGSAAISNADAPHSTLGVVGVIASMGARPCTSAFAILLLALANNQLWLGVVATFAMALGVAMTLMLVAVFSVDVREYARVALKRSSLPENAVGVVSLVAGALLASVAFVGLVQAAT